MWTMSKKRNKIIKIVVLILSALLLFVLFFPMKFYFKDGGTVMYAGCFGATYSISKLNKLTSIPGGSVGYRVGTVVEIFGITVYDDSYIDYEHAIKPEDNVNSQVDQIFLDMESSAENDDPDVVSEEIDSYIDSYNDSINESDIDYDNPVKIDDIAETDPSV